ncbi:hypothetical protein QE152_g24742 [Popillia japonica]|uniref:Uncharacterized protein n=1 Tax=Popillia japonica TaxID=7064 RepID=A0AAW1K2Q4_POPJA
MYKLIVFTVIVAIVNGAPQPEPKPSLAAAYVAAPVVAPAVVTATSSQVIARNYNTLAAPFVAAPVVRAAPLVAAPAVASYVASPYVAAPYVRRNNSSMITSNVLHFNQVCRKCLGMKTQAIQAASLRFTITD